ncbi:glycogen debranching N-terminal domain-containing protein [Yinghuangia aomiensis]
MTPTTTPARPAFHGTVTPPAPHLRTHPANSSPRSRPGSPERVVLPGHGLANGSCRADKRDHAASGALATEAGARPRVRPVVGTGAVLTPPCPRPRAQADEEQPRDRDQNAPPLAHDALICVDAPGMAICPRDGQLRGRGVHGLFHDGRRLLARSVVTIGGAEPEPLSSHTVGAGTARFLAMHRFVADPVPDPALVVDRTRQADGRERVVIRNTTRRRVRVPVEMTLGTDLAPIGELRVGRRGPDLAARVCPGGLTWSSADGWVVRAVASPAPETALAASGILRWDITLQPAASWTVELRVTGAPAHQRAGTTTMHAIPAPRAPLGPPPWSEARVRCDDFRVAEWMRQSLVDLRGLLVADPEHRTVPMPAAGAPGSWSPPAGTACGRHACCCPSAPASPRARCACWPTAKAAARTRSAAKNPARSRILWGPGDAPRATTASVPRRST